MFYQLYQGPVSAGIWKCSSTASLRALRDLRLGWGEGQVSVCLSSCCSEPSPGCSWELTQASCYSFTQLILSMWTGLEVAEDPCIIMTLLH